MLANNMAATLTYRREIKEAFERYKQRRKLAWDACGHEFSETCKAMSERAWSVLRLELRLAGSKLDWARAGHKRDEARAA